MTSLPSDLPTAPAAPPAPRSVRWYLARAAPFVVVVLLSVFAVHTYARNYRRDFGWTKMILFGPYFAPSSLPRLQRTPHYTEPGKGYGYDGQFYAQIALDPSLQDPGFNRALDSPVYRSRRIGLPALAFCAGWGNRQWVLQAYALSNLFFWFVLLGALCALLRPRTWQPLLCLSAALMCYGVTASMQASLVDLPATAMIFVGVVVGSWGGCSLVAAALLTRETSLLATVVYLDPGHSWRAGGWRRPVALLALAVVPFAGWILYVNHRFGHLASAAGIGNFSLPLQAMWTRFVIGLHACFQEGFANIFHKWWRFEWLYVSMNFHDLLTVVAYFVQGLYLVCRRDWRSAFWRIGICYTLLGAVLGRAVWEDPSAAARVLLPLTVCFYLRLAHERAAWFWPFFVVGSLSVPYGIHQFWTWA